jgi:hypothetical protein
LVFGHFSSSWRRTREPCGISCRVSGFTCISLKQYAGKQTFSIFGKVERLGHRNCTTWSDRNIECPTSSVA